MLRRSRQRGAAAVFAAISMVAGLVAAALAIDIGRLYFAQRDLQRVTGLAALDAARLTGGCFGMPDDAGETAFNEVVGSIGRNTPGLSAGIVPVRVDIGRMRTDAAGNRYFDPGPDDVEDSVRVELRRPAPGRLLPFFSGGRPLEQLHASASARSRPEASVWVGSRLAALNPDILNALLSQALGGPVNLDLLSYRNLFGADVPLGDILGPLDLGTPDEVLEIEIPARNLIGDLITALARTGDAAARAAAEQIGNALSSTAVVLPSQFLVLENTAAAAVNGTMVNAGALLLSVAQAANGSALLDLPLNLPPPLVTGGTRLRIVMPGRLAVVSPSPPAADNPSYAANGQAILESNLGIDLLGARVNLPLWVEVAQTVATVDDIQCARRGQAEDVVRVRARAFASRLGVGHFDDIDGPSPRAQPARILDVPHQLSLGPLTLPVPVRVTVDVGATVNLPSEERVLEFRSPWPDEPKTVGRPQAAVLLDALADVPAALQITVGVTGPNGQALPNVLNPAVALLRTTLEAALRTQLVNAIAVAGDALLQPVISGTGLSIGGADVYVTSMQNEQPYLFAR